MLQTANIEGIVPCCCSNAHEISLTCITFDDFVGRTAHQTVISIACNSDCEILAALQTVETVVRTQRHRLDADKFPMFSVGWTWQGYCRDLDRCWSGW